MSAEKTYRASFKHERFILNKKKEIPERKPNKTMWYAAGRKVRHIEITEYDREIIIDIAYYDK